MGTIRKVDRIVDAYAKRGDIPVYYEYTTGLAGRKLREHLRENDTLLGAKCPECEAVLFPPRIYCPDCMAEIEEFIPLEPVGTVVSFVRVYEDIDGNRFDEPKFVAFINVQDSEGGLFGFVEADELESGDYVKAVLKPREERIGAAQDILHWEKL